MEVIANQILADIKRQRKTQKENNDIKTISEKPEIEKAPEITGKWLNLAPRRNSKFYLLHSALILIMKRNRRETSIGADSGCETTTIEEGSDFYFA